MAGIIRNKGVKRNAGTRSQHSGYRQASPLLGFPDCNLPVLGSVPLSVSDITEKKQTKEPGTTTAAARNRSKGQEAERPETRKKHQHGQPRTGKGQDTREATRFTFQISGSWVGALCLMLGSRVGARG